MSKKIAKSTLKPGEAEYVACVKLRFNNGHLEVIPGMVIVLGPEDEAKGININNLLRNKSIVPYENDAQVKAIREQWERIDKPRRETLKADNIRRKSYG